MSAKIDDDIAKVIVMEPGVENFFKATPTRLENDPRGTLMISLKSEVLERFFLSICPDQEAIVQGKVDSCCYMAQAVNAKNERIYLMRLKDPLKGLSGTYNDSFILSDRVTPNLVPITAIGLKDGIDFIYKGMFTSKQINDALRDMYSRALEIYKEYAKPVSLSINIEITQKFD